MLSNVLRDDLVKHRIKELTGRSRGISMERPLTDLNRYVRGWVGYFGLARTPALRYAMTNKRPRATRPTVIKAGSGTSQLLFTQPPSADPHARWCGGCRQQLRRLPDLGDPRPATNTSSMNAKQEPKAYATRSYQSTNLWGHSTLVGGFVHPARCRGPVVATKCCSPVTPSSKHQKNTTRKTASQALHKNSHI